MKIPSDFDYGNLNDRLKQSLIAIVSELEEDGYFMISTVQRFSNCDVVHVKVRGKDPLLSPLKRCVLDTRTLPYLEKIIHGKMSYNFKIKDGVLYMPKNIGEDKFSITAPSDILSIGTDVVYTAQTPVEILWRLVKSGLYFIWDGCAPVPCHKMYFGYDNFSINIDYVDVAGNIVTKEIMKFENGRYEYTPVYAVSLGNVSDIDPVITQCKDIKLCDDFGRVKHAKIIDLKIYERNMFNQARFNKMYEKDYTLTVLNRMYAMASYLNGLNMILADLGSRVNKFAIPYRAANSFNVSTDRQHNTFSIQEAWYNVEIFDDVKRIYMEHKDKFTEYLRTKDDGVREELYEIVESECVNNYGSLLHYFINGILDALGIQKGDKVVRQEILSKYVAIVHKEFIMYGCYFYDLRTLFMRNNQRISQEFSSTVVVDEYNGYYFRVG